MTSLIAVLKKGRWWLASLLCGGLAATVLAVGSADAEEASYRTAEASTGDVTQTIAATGSIASASRYDLTFQVGGDVATVDVAVGDTVEAGQALATLDTGDLQDTLDQATEALAEAQQALEDDLDVQSAGTTTSSSSSAAGSGSSGATTSGSSSSGGASGGGDSAALSAARGQVVAAQGALLTQYDAAVLAAAAFDAAADAADLACTAFSDAVTAAADDATVADALAACRDASDAASDAQAVSLAAQTTLMDLATDLDDASAALVAAAGTSSSGGSGLGGSSSGGSSSGGGTTSGGGSAAVSAAPSGSGAGSSSSVPSAEDILADRAAITAAEAQVAVATQQLEYASLASPVAGKVIAATMAAGDEVTAGDTSTAITVVADNSYLVELSLGLSDVQLVKVGQDVSLTIVSTGQVVPGTVSGVSILNAGNSYVQSYTVTVAVPDPGFEIRLGAATRLAITVAQASGVLVVPTSAVADAAGAATVTVLDAGKPSVVSVTTGAIGSEYTEITSGLEEGQAVVLADMGATVVGSESDESGSSGLLGGIDSGDDEQQIPGGGQFPMPGGGMPPGQ